MHQHISSFLTGSTTPVLIGTKGNSVINQGYVWAPYIPINLDPINDVTWREWQRQNFRKQRKEKLKKLGWKNT